MNHFLRALGAAIVGTLIGGVVASAEAADLWGGSLKDDPYVGMSGAARVYLRGDIGYGLVATPDISESGVYSLDAVNEQDEWNYSGGIGWYLDERWRTDLTLDLRGTSDVDAVMIDAGGPIGPGPRLFDVTSTYALANLYYDFNVHPQLSPYLGAGIGFSLNHTGNGVAIDATSCDCSAGFEGADTLAFAWALMAGFSSDWGEGLHFDAGYRLVGLGNAETGDLIRISDSTSHGTIEVENMMEHQFRIGFRYDLY